MYGMTTISIVKPFSYEYENKYHVLIENSFGEVGISTLTIPEIAQNYGLILTDLEEALPEWL